MSIQINIITFATGSNRSATIVGLLAIPLWAAWPALALLAGPVPPLEFLTLAFIAAALVLWIGDRQASGAGAAPVKIAVAFGLAEIGSTGLFLSAVRYIPAAEANLIVFLWPAMTVVIASACGLFPIGMQHVLALVLGFSAVATLFVRSGIEMAPVGMALALMAGLSWAVYCVLRLRWTARGSFLARGAGVAAIGCAILHSLFEQTVYPGPVALLGAIGSGAIPTALANIFWDRGYQQGDARLLTVLAYATPLCSAVLLAVFGLERFTWRLFLSGLLIVAAGVLSTTGSPRKPTPHSE